MVACRDCINKEEAWIAGGVAEESGFCKFYVITWHRMDGDETETDGIWLMMFESLFMSIPSPMQHFKR